MMHPLWIKPNPVVLAQPEVAPPLHGPRQTQSKTLIPLPLLIHGQNPNTSMLGREEAAPPSLPPTSGAWIRADDPGVGPGPVVIGPRDGDVVGGPRELWEVSANDGRLYQGTVSMAGGWIRGRNSPGRILEPVGSIVWIWVAGLGPGFGLWMLTV